MVDAGLAITAAPALKHAVSKLGNGLGEGLPWVHLQKGTNGSKRAFSGVVRADHSCTYIFFPIALASVPPVTSKYCPMVRVRDS